MSRFTGPQRPGASRELRDRRRIEAETRQRADAARLAQLRAAYVEPGPVTGAELVRLLVVVRQLRGAS